MGQLAHGELTVLTQSEQQCVLRITQSIGATALAAPEPANRGAGCLKRPSELFGGVSRIGDGLGVQTATTSASAGAPGAGASSSGRFARAARSARRRMIAGITAAAVSPAEAQNAVP